MTNEDAIEIIETFRLIFDSPEVENKEVLLGAINKAIEALKNERPHGKWVEHLDYVGDTYYTCSHCGEDWTTIEGDPMDNLMNYCPMCGADMREDGKQ